MDFDGAAVQRGVLIRLGRIEWGSGVGVLQLDHKRVSAAWIVVRHLDAVVHVLEMRGVVSLGCTTNISCHGVDEEIPGDACPVHVKGRGHRGRGPRRIAAMVEVLQVPPGRRAVLASATHAEVPVGATVAEDEATPGHEVALLGAGEISGEQRQCSRHYNDEEYCFPSSQAHCDTSLCPSPRPALEEGRKRSSGRSNGGLRGPDDDIGQSVKGLDVQGIHDDAACRRNLFIQDDAQHSQRKGLIGGAGGETQALHRL